MKNVLTLLAQGHKANTCQSWVQTWLCLSHKRTEWSHITSFSVFFDTKMEHDSKTSLASVSTRSETNVKPPGKLRLLCSGPLLCSYDTWPPESPPFLHNDTSPVWALGTSGYPKLPFLQSASSELGRYEMLREFSRNTFSKVSSVYFYSLNSTTLPSNLSSIITNHEDFLPSTLVSAGVWEPVTSTVS